MRVAVVLIMTLVLIRYYFNIISNEEFIRFISYSYPIPVWEDEILEISNWIVPWSPTSPSPSPPPTPPLGSPTGSPIMNGPSDTFINWFSDIINVRTPGGTHHRYPVLHKWFRNMDTISSWTDLLRVTRMRQYIDTVHQILLNNDMNILPIGVHVYYEGLTDVKISIWVEATTYAQWVLDKTVLLHCTVLVHNSDVPGGPKIHNILLPSDETTTDILESVSNITQGYLNEAVGTSIVDLRVILADYVVW